MEAVSPFNFQHQFPSSDGEDYEMGGVEEDSAERTQSASGTQSTAKVPDSALVLFQVWRYGGLGL